MSFLRFLRLCLAWIKRTVGKTTSPEANSNADSNMELPCLSFVSNDQPRFDTRRSFCDSEPGGSAFLAHFGFNPIVRRFELGLALDIVEGSFLCHEHREVFPTYNMNPTYSIASRSFPIGSGKRQLQNKFTLRFADPSLAPKMRPALALLFW